MRVFMIEPIPGKGRIAVRTNTMNDNYSHFRSQAFTPGGGLPGPGRVGSSTRWEGCALIFRRPEGLPGQVLVRAGGLGAMRNGLPAACSGGYFDRVFADDQVDQSSRVGGQVLDVFHAQ